MNIDEIISTISRPDGSPKSVGRSEMKIRCQECGAFVCEELARKLSVAEPGAAQSFSANAFLDIPIWHVMVSNLHHGPEDVQAIGDALHKDLTTQECRSVAYSRRKLVNILLTGIDVVPTTSIFYSGRLMKSLIYGGCPKIVMLFDSSKLKPTMINLGPKPELKDIFNLSDTYPYAKTDRFGNYWRSRNNVEQTRFGPEERAYAHWIPGDAREALQEVIILDEGLSEYDDDKVFNEHLFNLLKCDD